MTSPIPSPSGSHAPRRGAIRRRMTRKVMKKLPRRANLHRYPLLWRIQNFARKRPYLWSFKSREVRVALYVGCVLASLPTVGVQAPLAIVAAFLTRSNITVLFGTQFITNPVTAAPYYWLTHTVGMKLQHWMGWHESLVPGWGEHANALLIGGVAVGLALAAGIEALWRVSVWEMGGWSKAHPLTTWAGRWARWRQKHSVDP